MKHSISLLDHVSFIFFPSNSCLSPKISKRHQCRKALHQLYVYDNRYWMMCSIIFSATSAWFLPDLTKLSSLKCKDNHFQKSSKAAGSLMTWVLQKGLSFRQCEQQKKGNSPKHGPMRFFGEYVSSSLNFFLRVQETYYISENLLRSGR